MIVLFCSYYSRATRTGPLGKDLSRTIVLNKIVNPTKYEVFRTSQETLAFVDWLISIVTFARFSTVSWLNQLIKAVTQFKTLYSVL